MNIILEDAIKASKTIILGESLIFGFSNYSPSYFSTTECIRDYLDDVKYEKTRALTVLASGDHIFSLINKGILNIDAFDINFLAYYTYHLRKAMILGLSREEFIDVNRAFVSTHDLEANLEFINELKDLMPDDVYQYYDEMLRFCLKLNPYLFKLLYCGYNGLEGVSYLDNDEEYERVREGLKIANINLYFGDADEIAPKLSEKYDIMFSNLY